MRRFTSSSKIAKLVCWSLCIGLIGLATACTPADRYQDSVVFNSRYTDQQPALSGDGRWLAFISNRNGSNEIVLYDLQKKQLIELSSLNQNQAIADSPSLSRTGRYLVYRVSKQGRPEIALYDRATKRKKRITQGYRGWVRNPYISPDGRYIVFESARRGQWDIEVLDRGANIELDIRDGTPVSQP